MSTKRSMSDETSHKDEIPPRTSFGMTCRFIKTPKTLIVNA